VALAAVPMPMFGEQQQQQQGPSGIQGLAVPVPMSIVKSEPREAMLGMYQQSNQATGSSQAFPATSSGAPMYHYSFLDGMPPPTLSRHL
jgi:hypothetical protein